MGLEMDEVAAAPPKEQGVEIYPLSRYYFGAKDATAVPGGLETPTNRALRLKAK
jgi:cleavage and polyadenylation specificity factor subunit 5